jgi:NAD(P)-dependent dehydrogenase (short-subunit alcohol dehydrogenase family)
MTDKKICLITGCNCGIGKETAIELAKKGYTILMLVRDSQKSQLAFEAIKEQSGNNDVKMFFVDLSSLKSINKVIAAIKETVVKIDILINNAAVYKRIHEKTEEGTDMTFAVNYLAPFYLTNNLLPLLEKSSGGRIINLTSIVYKYGKIDFDDFMSEKSNNINVVYGTSKLLGIHFTYKLAEKLKDKDITVNCVYPGIVNTDASREYPMWMRKLISLFSLKVEEGAKPVIHLATSTEFNNVTGKYFNKTKMELTTEKTYNKTLSDQIWTYTERLIERLGPN